MSDEAHRGGTLEEMSARGGTTIPKDAGTQPIAHSDPAEKRVYGTRAVDNFRPMPENPKDDNGITGEVVTGTGDVLPAGVEAKSINMDSTGGKGDIGGKFGHHVKKWDNASALGRPGRSRDDRPDSLRMEGS